MDDIVKQLRATNVTETDRNVTAVGDIVEQLRHMAWTAPEGEPYADALRDSADEIERLRAIITRQGMELLIAHSEALDLYDLTTPTDTEAT